MAKDDADKAGVADGEMVRVISASGELQTPLRKSNEVSMAELFMPWRPSGAPVNCQTRAEMDPCSKLLPLSSLLAVLRECKKNETE